MAKILDACRTAGPALHADDAVYGAHVPKPPLLKPVLEIDQLLAELVKIPIDAGLPIDRSATQLPRTDWAVCNFGLRCGPITAGSMAKSAPLHQSDHLVVEAGRSSSRWSKFKVLGPVLVGGHQVVLTIAEQKFDQAVLDRLEAR